MILAWLKIFALWKNICLLWLHKKLWLHGFRCTAQMDIKPKSKTDFLFASVTNIFYRLLMPHVVKKVNKYIFLGNFRQKFQINWHILYSCFIFVSLALLRTVCYQILYKYASMKWDWHIVNWLLHYIRQAKMNIKVLILFLVALFTIAAGSFWFYFQNFQTKLHFLEHIKGLKKYCRIL